jgi:TRAP-type C4-dicarboxylate transport system permease small subunit
MLRAVRVCKKKELAKLASSCYLSCLNIRQLPRENLVTLLYDSPSQSSGNLVHVYRIVRRLRRVDGRLLKNAPQPARVRNGGSRARIVAPTAKVFARENGGMVALTDHNEKQSPAVQSGTVPGRILPSADQSDRQTYSGVIGNLARVNEIVMIVLTIMMVSLVSYQVFERYVLHYTPPWSEELSVYLMIWFGMLGIAAGVRRGMHMSLHYFADKFPKNVQFALELLKYAMVIVYVSVLLWQGIVLVRLTMPQISAAMDLRIGYVYLSLPVSATLIMIYVLEKLYSMLFASKGVK